MASKRLISSVLGSVTLLAASLVACVNEDGSTGAGELRVATVDFGSGPIEIQFEDRDGEAVFEGDIVLGQTEDVQRGVLNMFWSQPAPGNAAADTQEPQEDPTAVAAQEAKNALESPEPPADLDALDDSDGSTAPDVTSAPPRNAQAALSHLNPWPGGRIPFVIESSVPQVVRDRIATAIADWNSLTIVRLVPHQSGAIEHFVRFTGPTSAMDPGEGNSAIGFLPGTTQRIRLGNEVSVSTIRHEIGHTVGLFHEQSRTDRDNFIRINWANIEVDKIGNFLTYVASGAVGLDFGSYDLTSIMHYNSFNGFAVDPAIPTLVRAGCSLVSTDPACHVTRAANLTSLDRRGVTRQVTGNPLIKFRLRNESTNTCLRPADGTTAANARVVLSSCDNTSSRRWYEFTRAGTSVPMIINENSRLCLARDTNNNLIQAHCTGIASQRYQTIDAGWDALFGGDVLKSDNRCITRVSGQAQPVMSTTCTTNSANRRWFKDFL